MAGSDPLPVHVGAGRAADVGEDQAAGGVPAHAGMDRVDVVRLETEVGVGAGAQDLLRPGRLQREEGTVAGRPGDDQRGLRRVLEGGVGQGAPSGGDEADRTGKDEGFKHRGSGGVNDARHPDRRSLTSPRGRC